MYSHTRLPTLLGNKSHTGQCKGKDSIVRGVMLDLRLDFSVSMCLDIFIVIGSGLMRIYNIQLHSRPMEPDKVECAKPKPLPIDTCRTDTYYGRKSILGVEGVATPQILGWGGRGCDRGGL